MVQAVDDITADPDPDNPGTFNAQAVLAWQQLIARIPQMNTQASDIQALADAMTLNSLTDTSTTSNSVEGGTDAKTFTVSSGKSFFAGMFLIIADNAAPATNYIFAQVTSYSGTTLNVTRKGYAGSGTKTSWNISFSAFPSIPYTSSQKTIVHTSNGFGSTNTRARRFTTTITDTLSSYADSATLGGSFTIPASGLYSVFYSDQNNASTEGFGISKNSSELTTSFSAIAVADRLMPIGYGTGVHNGAGCVFYLNSGDVLIAHGTVNMTNSSFGRVHIERLF